MSYLKKIDYAKGMVNLNHLISLSRSAFSEQSEIKEMDAIYLTELILASDYFHRTHKFENNVRIAEHIWSTGSMEKLMRAYVTNWTHGLGDTMGYKALLEIAFDLKSEELSLKVFNACTNSRFRDVVKLTTGFLFHDSVLVEDDGIIPVPLVLSMGFEGTALFRAMIEDSHIVDSFTDLNIWHYNKDSGENILDIAARLGKVEHAKILLEKRPDLYKPNCRQMWRNPEIREILKNKGLKVLKVSPSILKKPFIGKYCK